jgi:hypothetical protein
MASGNNTRDFHAGQREIRDQCDRLGAQLQLGEALAGEQRGCPEQTEVGVPRDR